MTESDSEEFWMDEKGVLLPTWFYLLLKHGSMTHGFGSISHESTCIYIFV